MRQQFLTNMNDYMAEQLQQLLQSYEDEIEQLQLENDVLHEQLEHLRQKIALLEDDNNELKLTLGATTQKLMASILADNKKEPELALTKTATAEEEPLTANNIPLDTLQWFEAYFKVLESANDELLPLYTKDLTNRLTKILKFTDKKLTQLISLLYNTLKTAQQTATIAAALHVISKLNLAQRNACYSKLQLDQGSVLNRLIKSEDAAVQKLQLLFNMNAADKIQKYIEFLLKRRKSIIETQFTVEQFAYLFWLAFYYDKLKLLQDLLKDSSHEHIRDNELTALYDQAQRASSPEEVNHYKKPLTNSKLFTLDELKLIYKKLAANLPALKAPTIEKKSFFVVTDVQVKRFIKEFHLQKGKVNVEVNGGQFPKTLVEAFVNPTKTAAYIAESELIHYQQQIAPAQLQPSKFYYNFTWPSTVVSQQPVKKEVKEHPFLNKESGIAKLGYHYTLNEKKRREILILAVNQYGLPSVAYTLSENTKRLKARKEDSLAASVWESDLHWLEKNFN